MSTERTWQWDYMVILLKGGWHLSPHWALKAGEYIAGRTGTVNPKPRVFMLMSKRLEKEGANT